MSIPPLVCSTPPPPDQCDDDKDHEDFDLSYRLSQDEDDAYDYSSFSSYNNFQTPENKPCNKKEQELPKPIVDEIQKEHNSQNTEQYIANNNALENNDTHEIKLKCEEDINIEDLNLEVNEDIAINIELENDESEIQGYNVNEFKEAQVSGDGNVTQHGVNTDSLCSDESATDSMDIVKVTDPNLDEVIDSNVPTPGTMDSGDVVTEEKISLALPIKFVEPVDASKVDFFSKDLEEATKICDSLGEKESDDDFGDFDNFSFTSPGSKITNIECDNPWEKNDTIQSDFGSFTANFEDNQFKVEFPTETTQGPSNELSGEIHQGDNDLENDDFGDFDDFKSSAVTVDETETTVEHPTPCQDVPVLNLHSNENEQQIMESISKVLTAIFLEEISEPDSQFEGKLDSLLSETWAHLMETDERQPYIVNWNNSLGQKTLLKALCIDSRNILFGPKWNTCMPKYAANLSVAPLQPQKPLTPSNASQGEINTDKASSKPTSWSDPFTSDGQESCNPENDNPGITTGPTDLDVFEGAMSTKSEKIYSSTPNVQPLRQINLPDTHIFTPTDSETPRSKTIHYDSSHTVLVPQSVTSDNKKETGITSNHISEIVGSSTEEDNEYWEFQDFKSTSERQFVKEHQIESIATTSEIAYTKPGVVFQTQPLQPIKVEPTMPKLNWPEPGEVKGTFDEFSDFLSISSQPAEKQGGSAPSDTLPQLETSKKNKPENMNDLNEEKEKVNSDIQKLSKEDFDDDFNTFQQALPSIPIVNKLNLDMVGNSTGQMPSSQTPDFDYAFPKTNSIKPDTISFPIIRPNEALNQILGYNSNTTEIVNINSLPSGTQLKANVLQPTPATFSAVNTQSKQKTGQILQPLSLESYSQINWPSPGIDLQDLSRFNPVETLQSLKSDLSVSGLSKGSSPIHNHKSNTTNQVTDDDVWGEFVSSNSKQHSQPKKTAVFSDDDEWTDFISSPSVKPQNGLNTISLNVHTNSNIQKIAMQNKFSKKNNQASLDIPSLNYITPKSSNVKSYNDRHFQNL